MFKARTLLLGIACFCVASSTASDEYKIVETDVGKVRGVHKTTLLRKTSYYSFKGIPYAEPPIGDLRFQIPQPVKSWHPEVLDAFDHSKVCIQPGRFLPHPFPQSEDCLTLNIFVPADVKGDEKLAVLFFIHGGGYTDGSSDDALYGPDFIVEKHTILVTFNYRLGVLGFLSLNSTEYSGNMGLKDQQLALKWVSSNIGQFGGDNKRITIFGHSAGGGSTHFHVLSAESRKYYRNAIPMSGSTLNFWAMSEANLSKRAYKIAQKLGEPQDSFESLLTFLKAVPAEEFQKHAPCTTTGDTMFTIPFAPIRERSDAKEPFMVDSPNEIYQTSKINVDALFTVTSEEMISMYPVPPTALLKKLDADFNPPLPFKGLDIPRKSEEHRSLNREVRKFYFGDATIDEQTIPQYLEYLSDINFVYGIHKSVKLHAAKSKGKTYYAWFSFDTSLNAIKHLEVWNKHNPLKVPGTGHGDELCYLFRCGIAQEIYEKILNNKHEESSKISLDTIDRITSLYTNFAKHGKPSHQSAPIDGFKPVRNDEIHYLDITNNGFKTGVNPRQKFITFWENLEKRARKVSTELNKAKRTERTEL